MGRPRRERRQRRWAKGPPSPSASNPGRSGRRRSSLSQARALPIAIPSGWKAGRVVLTGSASWPRRHSALRVHRRVAWIGQPTSMISCRRRSSLWTTGRRMLRTSTWSSGTRGAPTNRPTDSSRTRRDNARKAEADASSHWACRNTRHLSRQPVLRLRARHETNDSSSRARPPDRRSVHRYGSRCLGDEHHQAYEIRLAASTRAAMA